jgi:RNA polymerase sigma-70 factor (ECF subfamily)
MPLSNLTVCSIARCHARVYAAPILASLLSILATLLTGVRVDDALLLQRIAQGDRSALQTLYTRVAPRAMAIAIRVLKDRAEAEDVVQDTFVDLWRRAAQFDPSRGAVQAWVLTMTRNRALDRLRARQSSARAVAGAGNEPTSGSTVLPNDASDSNHERARVAEALASLPSEQRRVIELAYFDGLTQNQIAVQTNEPLGTVKTRVRLAMAKLADLLATEREGAA